MLLIECSVCETRTNTLLSDLVYDEASISATCQNILLQRCIVYLSLGDAEPVFGPNINYVYLMHRFVYNEVFIVDLS